jgi:hypothetical protein
MGRGKINFECELAHTCRASELHKVGPDAAAILQEGRKHEHSRPFGFRGGILAACSAGTIFPD